MKWVAFKPQLDPFRGDDGIGLSFRAKRGIFAGGNIQDPSAYAKGYGGGKPPDLRSSARSRSASSRFALARDDKREGIAAFFFTGKAK